MKQKNDVMTMAEVCKFFRVGPGVIRKMVETRGFPGMKRWIDRRYRWVFSRRAIDRWWYLAMNGKA